MRKPKKQSILQQIYNCEIIREQFDIFSYQNNIQVNITRQISPAMIEIIYVTLQECVRQSYLKQVTQNLMYNFVYEKTHKPKIKYKLIQTIPELEDQFKRTNPTKESFQLNQNIYEQCYSVTAGIISTRIKHITHNCVKNQLNSDTLSIISNQIISVTPLFVNMMTCIIKSTNENIKQIMYE